MDQHGLAPKWRIAEWLNTSAPIRLAEQRGRVVVACAFQMLCPGCVARAIPQLKAVHDEFSGMYRRENRSDPLSSPTGT